MKLLEKGNVPEKWESEELCTGAGNGGGGCNSKLLVEEGDLFFTTNDTGGEYFITFECPCCGMFTDLSDSKIPATVRKNIVLQEVWGRRKCIL